MGQPGCDLSGMDAAEQGNATLTLTSCQIVSSLSYLLSKISSLEINNS